MVNVDDLSELKAFDLRTKFPRPHRAVVRRCFSWILSYLALLALIYAATPPTEVLYQDTATRAYSNVVLTILTAGTLILVGKVIYEIWYHQLYYYGIEESHLVVSVGIFLRDRAAIPLTHITDIYLERDALDFCFALYNLYPTNPSANAETFSDIHGLSPRSAVALQDYLAKLCEDINPESKRAIQKHPPQREVPVAA